MAQNDEAASLAGHPIAGAWLFMANPALPESPQIGNVALFRPDGTAHMSFPPTQLGPRGLQFNSDYLGIWKPDTDRRAHFTIVQLLSDLDGNFTGTVTVDGFPEVAEDGETFIDTGEKVVVTIRDPSGAIVDQFPGRGGRPVNGLRMVFGAPKFPDPVVNELPEATPTS
jgi:hypothetical protein